MSHKHSRRKFIPENFGKKVIPETKNLLFFVVPLKLNCILSLQDIFYDFSTQKKKYKNCLTSSSNTSVLKYTTYLYGRAHTGTN